MLHGDQKRLGSGVRTGQGKVIKPVKIEGPTHSQIQKTVRDLLEWNHWKVWHNQQGLGSHPGVTDLTAAKKSVIWWIEIKTKGTYLSLVQQKFRDMILGEGCNWMVAYSIEDVIAKIPELGGRMHDRRM